MYVQEKLKKGLFNVLKRNRLFKRIKREKLVLLKQTFKNNLKDRCFKALKLIAHRLRETSGDPLLVRSIIGKET